MRKVASGRRTPDAKRGAAKRRAAARAESGRRRFPAATTRSRRTSPCAARPTPSRSTSGRSVPASAGAWPCPDGKTIMHAELQIGNSIVFLADEFPDMGCRAPQTLGGATGDAAPLRAGRRPGLRAGRGRGRSGADAGHGHVLGRPLRQGRRSVRPRVGPCDAQGGSVGARDRPARRGVLLADGRWVVSAARSRGRCSRSWPRRPSRPCRSRPSRWAVSPCSTGGGSTVGGVEEPVTRLLREAVPEPEGPASVLGTDRTASPVTAALWNGTASHALDYDDTVLALPGHVTAPLLPGLLAIAETRRTPGGTCCSRSCSAWR